MLATKEPAFPDHPGQTADTRARGRLQRANRVIIAKGSGMLYRINESVSSDESAPVKGKTMRAVKGIVIALLAVMFTQTLGYPRILALLWAQTSNPLIMPVPPPAAPSQLPAPVTTAIAPILEPVPTLPAPTPTPSERVFNCSCYGPAQHTSWMGEVTAQGYFAARKSAVGTCVSYNEREPQSPLLGMGASAAVPPILPGSAIPGSATQLGHTLPGTLSASAGQPQQMCSECFCD
jgi:hypothetical protein